MEDLTSDIPLEKVLLKHCSTARVHTGRGMSVTHTRISEGTMLNSFSGETQSTVGYTEGSAQQKRLTTA